MDWFWQVKRWPPGWGLASSDSMIPTFAPPRHLRKDRAWTIPLMFPFRATPWVSPEGPYHTAAKRHPRVVRITIHVMVTLLCFLEGHLNWLVGAPCLSPKKSWVSIPLHGWGRNFSLLSHTPKYHIPRTALFPIRLARKSLIKPAWNGLRNVDVPEDSPTQTQG